MTRPIPHARAAFAAALCWAAPAPARAADLPAPPPARFGAPARGGGFYAPAVPLRPPPWRYDIYGYPLFTGVPSPLAVGGGCPAAVQPAYDPDGNLAGYAPIPMCR